MLVDSPDSALANSSVDLTGYVARASVFARMMTSAEALQYIGKAAGINGNLIDANGPIEINGSPTATHAPVAIENGQDLPAPTIYKLYVRAEPVPSDCGRVRDGPHDRAGDRVGQRRRDRIRQLRQSAERDQRFAGRRASRSVSSARRPEASSIRARARASRSSPSSAVFAIWCWLVLFVSRLRADLRAAKRGRRR